MVLPERHKAAQQIRTTQHRAVCRSRATEGDVVTTTGTSVTAIKHELLGAKAGFTRRLVQFHRVGNQLAPVVRRVNIHLDHTRVWRHQELLHAPVFWRLIAFDQHRHLKLGRGLFDQCHQVEVTFQIRQRWHKDMQGAVTRLDAQRGANHRLPDSLGLLCLVLALLFVFGGFGL